LSGVSDTSPSQQSASAAPIYLIATAGHPNFGDEFITAAWLRFLARARPDVDVWLDSPNPGLTPLLFGGLHPRLQHTDTLWRLMAETKEMAPEDADAHIDRVVTHLGSPRYDLGLINAREAGSIHLLGGGHMNALWQRQDRLLRAALRLREVSDARLMATGLGLMPAEDPAALRHAVEEFDHFSVRDAPSAEVSGAELLGDDAFLGLQQAPGFRDTAVEDGDVWVNLQSDVGDAATFESAVEAVRAALSAPEFADRTVRYVEGIPGGDHVAFDKLSDVIPRENFVPFLRLWEEGFPGMPGQTWITTRFHFHLLAAACGARGTALVIHDDYYGVKHQSLIDAGTGWSLTPRGAATISEPSAADDFRSRAAELQQAKVLEAESLYPRRVTQSRRRGGWGSTPRGRSLEGSQ
jgi:hypothetical protein